MIDLTYVKTFEDIIEEYEFTSTQLRKKVSYYNKLISKGYKVPSASTYFKYVTLADSTKIREQLELEINRKYVLELTATCEAKIAFYLKKNIKRSSTLNASYTANVSGAVRSGGKHLMFQHLLPVFKEQIRPKNNIVYSEFKNLVDYRNWLAHGRSWELPLHLSKFDFEYSYEAIIELINRIPDFPDFLKR